MFSIFSAIAFCVLVGAPLSHVSRRSRVLPGLAQDAAGSY